MGWVECIGEAIGYIEDNITGELTIEKIAKRVSISPFYFQKGFAMLCGFTVGEYIRERRLALAGSELVSTDEKIIDIALKYGYDSPDSFTKAFTRFHGVTPTAVRKGGAMIKSFAPLKIKFTLKGGYAMNYRIMEKDSFTVMGASREFTYDDAKTGIPMFWSELHQPGKKRAVCGMYGICIDDKIGSDKDDNMGADKFEYLIADNYNPAVEIAEGFVTRTIPAHTWAVFPCRGSMPQVLQNANKAIFSEWLPNCKDFEIAAGYNIEMYNDPSRYAKGTQDENYYSEIWIPVKRKNQK